jgi:hypothetical protein
MLKTVKNFDRRIHLNKYKFNLLHTSISNFKELDHIIPAHSLTDAIQKFIRKHELEAPAYWDEPSFDKNIELTFKSNNDVVKYHISW